MKKIILILILALSIANASWFISENNEQESKSLQATPFAEFENKISEEAMMIEFGSVSCHSCQVMGELLYKIKRKHPEANIYFVDIYKDKAAAKKYAIRMIPTQKYLDKDGKIIETHMGILKQEVLEKKLKSMGII